MNTTNQINGGPYDETYAAMYNSIWWDSDTWAPEGKFHIETIAKLLKPGGSWLDAGCGNGFFLSQFPEVNRNGLDFSAAMIHEAQKANKDVVFHQQSLTDENEALNGQFNLVTCTGQPWSYLPTLDQIEIAVKNLASWTSDDGKCMLTPVDISDFVPINFPVFHDMESVPNNYALVTGIHWTYKELDHVHHYCLSPMLDQWMRWFSKYFKKVEILRWPHEPKILTIPRRVIVCSEKRKEGDNNLTEFIMHPIPGSNHKQPAFFNPASNLTHKMLLHECFHRLKSGAFFKAIKRKIIYKIRY